MALITCPECGNQISDNAKSCPNCGWSNSALSARKKVNRWSIISIVLSVFGILWAFTIKQESLYNGTGAYDITVNGVPLQFVLAIPPLVAIIVSVLSIALKNMNMGVRTAITIVGIIIIWGVFLIFNFTGMFKGNGAGIGMIVGSFLVSVTMILTLVASRKL